MRYFNLICFCIMAIFIISSPIHARYKDASVPSLLKTTHLNNVHHVEEHLWMFLLKSISDLESPDVDQIDLEDFLLNRSGHISSSVKAGLATMRTNCRALQLEETDSEVCQKDNFRDLAYAFSYMNRGWLQSFRETVDLSALTLTLASAVMHIGYINYYNNRMPLYWSVISNAVYYFTVEKVIIKAEGIQKNIFSGNAVVNHGADIDHRRHHRLGHYFTKIKNKALGKLMGEELKVAEQAVHQKSEQAMQVAQAELHFPGFRDVATELAMILGPYLAKAASDLMVRDYLAFRYYLEKHTYGHSGWLSGTGSLIYKYGNENECAQTYFNTRLDMNLYYSLLVYYLSHYVILQKYTEAETYKLPEKMDLHDVFNLDQGGELALPDTHCTVVTYDFEFSDTFPVAYLTIYKARFDNLIVRINGQSESFICPEEKILLLLQRLSYVFGARRVAFYDC